MIKQLAFMHPALSGCVLGFGLVFAPVHASAANICNCCNTGQSGNCKSACEEISKSSSLCRPTVDFDGETPSENVLYGKSLRGIKIGNASRRELETFRRMIEKGRASAEAEFSVARRDYRRRRTTNADFLSAQAKRDEALVNYHHAMQAFVEAARR